MNETWWRNPEQLDRDQQAIVSLPLEGSHLVVGPPGSGKTNLLLLRATFLARAGLPNIAVITFNRLLREFLATGVDNYAFEAERIQTFRSWAVNLLRANGDDVDTSGAFQDVRERLIGALSDLRAQSGDELKCDCILLDEAQDYKIEEIELVRHFAKDVFAVGDVNQRIYEHDGALRHLARFCHEAPALKYHYRNGPKICRLADGIMNIQEGGMFDTCNYDEARYPSSVNRIGQLDLEGQVREAFKMLETQLVAYPEEWIGVLAPLRRDVGAIYDLLVRTSIGDRVQLQKYDEGYDALDPNRPIIVATMHSAKGLEFRAAHLLALDTLPKMDNHQRLTYTAVTRAKTSLSLYHRGAVPGYIERGLVAVEGAPVEAPRVADLFGAPRR